MFPVAVSVHQTVGSTISFVEEFGKTILLSTIFINFIYGTVIITFLFILTLPKCYCFFRGNKVSV